MEASINHFNLQTSFDIIKQKYLLTADQNYFILGGKINMQTGKWNF